MTVCGITGAYALPVTHYATHSQLSEGTWVRIRVSGDGAHFISDQSLRTWGFSDPSKVRVYGTGGRMEPEGLSVSMADDLPLVPSVRSAKGLVFFATGNNTWEPSTSADRPYVHTVNAYTDKSYYFLSDRENDAQFGSVDMRGSGGDMVRTFTDRQVHEQELQHLGESGRTYVGEDFRSTKSRTFSFPLPDNAGETALYRLRFASKVTGGGATVDVTVGEDGPEPVRINGVDAETYAAFADISGSATAGDKLDITVEYNSSGALFLANLDYIEVFNERRLAMRNGELSFFGNFAPGSTLELTGVEDGTVIWDVTDPVRPMAVEYTRDGDKALMQTGAGGYREYAAYTPSRITRTVTSEGRVANQDLHGMEAPDMLIITPATYLEGARAIARMHSDMDGMDVLLLDPQQIYNEFSGGKPDVSAWRKLLKMWHDRGRAPGYCLIMGKPSYDNKYLDAAVRRSGYVPVPIWQSLTGTSEKSSYSNDDYIGMLDDVEPGNFYINRAQIHVAVGRLPVKDAAEAQSTAAKIVKHVTEPNVGAWRNKVMLIADDNDNSAHFLQTEACYENMKSHGKGSSFLYDRLYLDSYPLMQTATGPAYPQATARMLNNYNEGVALTTYAGHASEYGWGHEQLWTWEEITAMANPNLPFIYTATCRFTPWDELKVSGGEHLMLNTRGGVVGMITATRTAYISQNGELTKRFGTEVFKTESDGRLRRLGDAYIAAKNSYPNDENKLRYAFMGDPAMRLTEINHTVTVDNINGIEVATAPELPVIEGGSRLTMSGRILAPDGSEATDFNGTVSLQLYDAETVIETYGNGSSGKKEIYNDRKTRLAVCNTSVRNGRWSATVTVPLEISNNYQPALVSAYAWDNRRREANGSSESLYVYGFSEDAVLDTEGPRVDHFYLNRENFRNGDIVNPNPVVFIRLSDPAGINVSDAGVGHKLSLRLDDETPLGDVSQYYTPDVDGTGGTVIYGLKDLTPGRHTLTLEAWDNLNNSTRQSLDFQVSANADPYIVDIVTDCNPATSGVNFKIILDQPNTMMDCNLSVYDLSGREIWRSSMRDNTGTSGQVNTYWNLCDKSGARVPRGIYVYRARVETPQGTWSTKSNKLAVTAQ